MHYRRLLHLALTPALALGLTCLGPSLASADDEDASKPKRVRIRLTRPKPGQPSILHEKAIVAPQKDPMQTVMRWAMGEMGTRLSGAENSAGAHLKQWFEGGDDVPAAGLRDALKTDGWTAASLEQWLAKQLLTSAPQMMQLFSGHAGTKGPAHGSFQRSFRLRAPQWPQAHGNAGAGCPHCGSEHEGHARRGARGNMHGEARRSWRGRGQRGGRWGRRAGAGRHGHGGGRGWGGHQGQRQMGMWGTPGHVQSRTVILWNDGSGWHRQEVPGSGMGPGPRGQGGMGAHGMGPGGMGPGRMHAGPMGPHGEMPAWLRQMMGSHGRGPGGMGSHGRGPHGMGPRGMGSHGRGPHGMGPRGMGSHGRGPQGMGPRGMGPHGGSASRHGGEVHIEKAMPWMKMLKELQGQDGHAGKHGEMPWMKILQNLGSGEGGQELKVVQELLKKLGADQSDGASKPRVRVKIIQRDGSDDAQTELVIQEEVIKKKIEKALEEKPAR